jgi:hypothetical protein
LRAAGLTGPSELGKQQIEPPGATYIIGTRRLHRVTNCHEPALQSNSDVTGQAGRPEKALRHEQPPCHIALTRRFRGPPIRLSLNIESREKFSRGPNEAAVDINRQHNAGVRLDPIRDLCDSLVAQAYGEYARIYQIIMDNIVKSRRNHDLESAAGLERYRQPGP